DLPALCIEYPLLVKRDDENFALRAVMGFDKERKSLIFAGTVPEDSIVTFSSSPGFEVIDRTCEEIKHFHKKHPKADLIILFSCIARHLALGPVINEEITYPAEKWNTTVTGFFTYGEIGTNDNSPCDFYNQTYSLVILKEKS
ncbi:MAG TPA: FIST C-terminal domain-containing protein, partial [Bacteroidales bacterium]|nr:FIST C-terminal domain-containing protein [Bacteroidales bacterium]